MKDKIYKHLNNVFREIFDDETIAVNDMTTPCSVEDEFGIKFNIGKTISLKNVGEMVELIEEKLK